MSYMYSFIKAKNKLHTNELDMLAYFYLKAEILDEYLILNDMEHLSVFQS